MSNIFWNQIVDLIKDGDMLGTHNNNHTHFILVYLSVYCLFTEMFCKGSDLYYKCILTESTQWYTIHLDTIVHILLDLFDGLIQMFIESY